MENQQPSFVALTKKEFFSYMNSGMAYVVIVPFLLIATFLFFRTALLLGDANMRPFIELLPWFLVVIAPALAMRSFTDEFDNDTIELLYAHPVSEWTIVLSKFFGLALYFLVFLATTIAMPLIILMFSSPDLGLMGAQYLGALFLGALFLSVGMMASAYVRSSVGSFLVGAAVNFVIVLIGMNIVTLMFPAPFNAILGEFGVMNHINNISRGVIDLRDVVYFASFIGVVLSATVIRLSERKFAEDPEHQRRLMTVLGLIAGIGIATNVVLADYPIRLDVTANQRHSLSEGSKQLLRDLPDRLNITLYSSPNLPGPMQVTLRETTDRLRDFARFGERVNLRTVTVDDEESTQEAQAAGMREVTFNQIATSSFQVQTGYLGLELQYGEQTETIPFVEESGDLEYQLSRLILSMTRQEQPQLGYANLSAGAGYSEFDSILREQYELTMISDTSDDADWSELEGVIVVDAGEAENATVAAQLEQYVNNNGNVAAFIDGVNVNQAAGLVAQPSQSAVPGVFASFGITVQENLVYDLQQNEQISLGQGVLRYIVPYPFWVRAQLNQETIPWSGASQNALLGWPSEVVVAAEQQTDFETLLATGPISGVQTEDFTVQPQETQELTPDEEQAAKVLGVIGQRGEGQRIVVIGDTHLLTDDFLQNTPENVSLVSNMVDWVAADEILASIPKRTAGRNTFAFTSAQQAQVAQYGSLIVPPVLVAGFGIFWLRRRKQLSYREYQVAS